jgi:hypothetical protein
MFSGYDVKTQFLVVELYNSIINYKYHYTFNNNHNNIQKMDLNILEHNNIIIIIVICVIFAAFLELNNNISNY